MKILESDANKITHGKGPFLPFYFIGRFAAFQEARNIFVGLYKKSGKNDLK